MSLIFALIDPSTELSDPKKGIYWPK